MKKFLKIMLCIMGSFLAVIVAFWFCISYTVNYKKTTCDTSVSPDGKHVIYLTFAKGELEPNEHLPNMYVSLGMMDYDGQNKKKLLDLFGGQGSINVNSWAPDSRRIAYVKYVLHHK